MADAASFDKQMAAAKNSGFNCDWHKIPCENIDVTGLGFFHKEKQFCRLPLETVEKMQSIRKSVADLAFHTAGASLNFCTDSPEVFIHAILSGAPYMSHMTAAGQCGFDCYVKICNKWFFAGVTKFSLNQSEICCRLAQNLKNVTEICINLPLYIGVSEVSVGVCQNYSIRRPLQPENKKAIAFYGTSITQGGCASRPGMAYPSILGRMLNTSVYNLGFSGNGVGNIALAKPICDLPHLGALVIDIVPNAGPEGVLQQNLPIFLNEVRKISPQLPILVLSGTYQTPCIWDNELAEKCNEFTNFEQQLVNKMRLSGDKNIIFANTAKLMGDVSFESTVDGVHLTDLGFYELAKVLHPIILQMINEF